MSSITTTDEEADLLARGSTEPRFPNYKRRKLAIFFAFCGVGYQGMQKNPGAKTIEGEFEEALFHAGAVPDAERGKPKLYDWARSARTDKGVSAVGQVVSGSFYIDPPGFVERLNSNLPDQIKVFGYKLVAPSFSSKKSCDRRRYVYLLPVFALNPISHRDREAVMASLASGEEYVKCLECSERGRKIPGVVGNFKGTRSNTKSSDIQSDILSDSSRILVRNETLTSILPNGENTLTSVTLENAFACLRTDENPNPSSIAESVEVTTLQEESCKLNMESAEKINGETKNMNEAKTKFSYGDKEKERFNRILSYYIGSHNFHNFTTRTTADDPAANRHIISFTANTIITLDGIDFIKCEVLGKSFMLHQIRKMMGLAVAIMRNCTPESLIQTAFTKDLNITVPMAPEVGLYLDECFFTAYNKKFEDSHEEVSLEPYREETEEFKLKHIYSHMGSAERKYGNMALWLHSLNHRNYPDLNYQVKTTDQSQTSGLVHKTSKF